MKGSVVECLPRMCEDLGSVPSAGAGRAGTVHFSVSKGIDLESSELVKPSPSNFCLLLLIFVQVRKVARPPYKRGVREEKKGERERCASQGGLF